MLGVESRKAGGSRPNARGPDPVCFGAGCLERPRFYKINFMLVTFNVLVVFSTGMSESVKLRPFGQLCPDGLFTHAHTKHATRTSSGPAGREAHARDQDGALARRLHAPART